MAKFPTYEQMAKNVAEKALDEILYDGKSIREWMKIIVEKEPKTDVPDINDGKIKQEPCEDCISRANTLKPYETLKDDDVISVWLVKKNIEQQKTVNPRIEYGNDGNPYRLSISNGKEYEQEPKTGHWIPVYQGDEIINYRCSACAFGNTFGKKPYGMNYCPNCGARMEANND